LIGLVNLTTEHKILPRLWVSYFSELCSTRQWNR